MTLPATGTFLYDGVKTNTSMGPLFEQWLAHVKAAAGGTVEETLTISSGSVTPTRYLVKVSASGSTGTLDRMAQTNFPEGSLLMVRAADGKTITVTHQAGGAGHFWLNSPRPLVLSTSSKRLFLRREGTQWTEDARSHADDYAAWRSMLQLQSGATWIESSQPEAVAGTASTSIMTPRRVRDALQSDALMHAAKTYKSGYDVTNAQMLYSEGGTLWKVNIATLLAASFTTAYTSGELSLGSNAGGSFAHGLGGQPSLVQGYIRCKTANQGYAVGDEVQVDNNYSSDDQRGLTFGANATDVFYRCASNGSGPQVVPKGGGAFTGTTAGSWRLIIRARR
jgi:hypothetical protein